MLILMVNSIARYLPNDFDQAATLFRNMKKTLIVLNQHSPASKNFGASMISLRR